MDNRTIIKVAFSGSGYAASIDNMVVNVYVIACMMINCSQRTAHIARVIVLKLRGKKGQSVSLSYYKLPECFSSYAMEPCIRDG